MNRRGHHRSMLYKDFHVNSFAKCSVLWTRVRVDVHCRVPRYQAWGSPAAPPILDSACFLCFCLGEQGLAFSRLGLHPGPSQESSIFLHTFVFPWWKHMAGSAPVTVGSFLA